MSKATKTMAGIKFKIAVAGGKGGVGKSMCTSNIAMALAMIGNKVSVLDQDFDGSTIPKMFGIKDRKFQMGDKGLIPVEGYLGIQVVSMGLVQKEDEVITMFHGMRRGTTEEFLSHVDYGERDFLLIDLPPGTSSDSVNLMQYIPDLDGVVVVTVPPKVSQMAARRAALLAMKAGKRVLGIIENMSGYICPNCGTSIDLMKSGGGEMLAKELGVPFLGKLPLHPELSKASDEGMPFVYQYPDNLASQKVMEVAKRLQEVVINSRKAC